MGIVARPMPRYSHPDLASVNDESEASNRAELLTAKKQLSPKGKNPSGQDSWDAFAPLGGIHRVPSKVCPHGQGSSRRRNASQVSPSFSLEEKVSHLSPSTPSTQTQRPPTLQSYGYANEPQMDLPKLHFATLQSSPAKPGKQGHLLSLVHVFDLSVPKALHLDGHEGMSISHTYAFKVSSHDLSYKRSYQSPCICALHLKSGTH